MINLTIGETIELQECRRALEQTLSALDHLGAGIAAIHVNAAVEQLTSNLEMIERARQKAMSLRRSRDADTQHVTH